MLNKFVDTLIISEGNREAINIAREAQLHRHILIFGHLGMGKTHMLNAIYRDIQNDLPKINVQLISADEFSHGLIKALKTHQYTEFIDGFYELDGLLVDDLECCDGKPRTQQELCRLVKYFKEKGKFLVISVSQPLNKLESLDVKCRAMLSSFRSLGLGGIDSTLSENFANRLCQELGKDIKKQILERIEKSNVQNFYDLMSIYNDFRFNTGSLPSS